MLSSSKDAAEIGVEGSGLINDFLGVFARGRSSVTLQSMSKTVQRDEGLAGTWREAHIGVDTERCDQASLMTTTGARTRGSARNK